jgi:FkbM family methyltransferase
MNTKRICKKLYKKFIEGELYFHINKDDVVFDIGACTGEMALFYSWKVGDNGKVYAIEPDRVRNIEYISKLIEDKKNIKLLKFALGKEDGEGTLYLSTDSSHHSIYKDLDWNIEHNVQYTELPIKIHKLDTIVEMLHLEKLNVLYMNVEGAEYDVLLGAEKTLQTLSPKIHLAIHSMNKKKYTDEILDFLDKHGYKVRQFEDQIYASKNEIDFIPYDTRKCDICEKKITVYECQRFDGVCVPCWWSFTEKWLETILG